MSDQFTTHLIVRVTPEHKAKLKAIAKAQGVSLSAAVRRALQQGGEDKKQ